MTIYDNLVSFALDRSHGKRTVHRTIEHLPACSTTAPRCTSSSSPTPPQEETVA
ncbi:hypothetical protein [Streptomyces xanthochromogenes]|uniref:hypothetical protein n=1 Tax=Streptomyces xanthochromogenes TaxID=67384 RepID=UPI00342E85C6